MISIAQLNISNGVGSSDYKGYIEETKPGRLRMRFEDSLNSPISSELKFTLDNKTGIYSAFYGNQPYSILGEGEATYYDNGIPATKRFHGYMNKTSGSRVDPLDNNFPVSFVGIEQKYANSLMNFDITQIFNELDATPTRQRGGRSSASRYAPSSYNQISSLVQTMILDLGLSAGNIIISFDNSSDLKWKYDEETFGDINQIIPIMVRAERSPYDDRQVWKSSFTNPKFDITLGNKESESYNWLLQEFAKLTGCIYFFEHRTGKFFFINRDYDFTSDLSTSAINIDSLIVDESQPIRYYNSYNGISINFNDIKVLLKITRTGIIPTPTHTYGVEGDGDFERVSMTNIGSFYYLKNPSGYAYKIGSNTPENGLYVSNPINIDISLPLNSFLVPGIDGQSIETFIKTWIYNNYEYIINNYRGKEVSIWGEYHAPLRVIYGGTTINVFDTEYNFNDNITRLRFDY